MVSPKQLDFSSSGGVGDSDLGDATLSRRKSPRTPSSKPTAPEVTVPEEETKKKRQRTDKKKKKNNKKETKTKLSSPPSSSRIWNEEEEVTILKGLVDFRAKKGVQSKIDWDEYYRLLGVSIVEKFSKDQVYSKIRKLRRRYFVCMEKINQGNDPKFTRVSDLENFGYSKMIWGQAEAATNKELLNELEEHGAGTENGRKAHQSDGGELKEHEEEAHDESLNENEAVAENVSASGEKILKEQEEEAGNERLNGGNEAVAENVTGSGEKNLKEQEEEAGNERLNGNEAVTESGTARQAHQIETGEEMMKQQDEEADVERLNENRAAKITETNDAKEGQGDNAELYVVQDAFETLISHGLSSYQKKIQLEKLLNIGTDKMRELSNEWEALCDEERSLNLKKLRYSTKLAEALLN